MLSFIEFGSRELICDIFDHVNLHRINSANALSDTHKMEAF